ncbi:MAG TPA: Mrp/NBP35 family ATP-binding protein [Acidimicrobiales bacterium]|nr:Mrp/NBP35 family ATP-binding protein [Acidimicrobiales bacterium]
MQIWWATRRRQKGTPKEKTLALSEQHVLEALRSVKDPELGVSIVELDMVRALEVRRGRVAVTVALTVPGCPMKDEITRLVTEAVEPIRGVKDVRVDLTVMTPAELDAVRAKVSGRSADPAAWSSAGHAHGQSKGRLGHEEGRPNPFGPQSRTRVIGVSSGKGGVGKSSVTVNLAVALARAGHDVAVLDADVYGFSVPGMLGIDTAPTVKDQKMEPPSAFGVRCMSMGFFIDDEQPVIWRGPMLHKALEQFLVDVDWGDPEFLLVDMPPGTGDVALSMAQYLPTSEVYVVTTPQPAATRVAQRSAYMAKKLNLPMRGVIENMSWLSLSDGSRQFPFGEGGGTRMAEELGVPLLGQIPMAVELREGGDEGRPVAASETPTEASRAFAELAAAVVAKGKARVFRPELSLR